MNRRLSPNRCLTRSLWRTVKAIDVFPMPPAPMRAMGVRFSVRPTILSISSSRPKNALGGGGGNSPGTLHVNIRCWIHFQSRLLTWLGSGKWRSLSNSVAGHGTNVTHRLILIIGPLLTVQHVAMHIGNHGTGFCNTVMNIGNNHMGIYCELGL